jgi:hypothetical protein
VLVFLCSLAAYVWVTHRFIDFNTPHDKQSWNLTGDEPSYMLICQSIVLDRDVNLFNDASRGRKGSTFGCPSAGPHKARVDVEKGLVYSIHSPGLPMMISPVFALAMKTGMTPRYACVLFLNVLAAAGMVLLFVLARHFGASTIWAMALSFATGCSIPPLIYSHQIYPDFPAAVVLLTAYCSLWLPARDTPAGRILMAASAGLCAAWLPWLHIRFSIFSAGLAVACAVRFKRSVPALLAAAVPVLVSAGCLMMCYQRWYGSPWPSAAYIAQTGSAPLSSGIRATLRGLSGVALDGGRGLLSWAPFWFFVPAGLVMAVRRRPVQTALLVAPAMLYMWIIASFDSWWGGFCPPNRFVLPVIPVLAALLAAFLAGCRPSYRHVVAALMVTALLFSFRAASVDLRDLYSGRHVLETHSILRSDLWFPVLLPDVKNVSRQEIHVLVAWAVAVVWMNVRVFVPRRKKPELTAE